MINEILISKTNLINNIKQVRLNNPNSLLCAMVKANAYGVGMKEVAKIIDPFVDFYGVACFFEAKRLKKYTQKKILILGKLDTQGQRINIDIEFVKNGRNLVFTSGWMVRPKGTITNNTPLAD